MEGQVEVETLLKSSRGRPRKLVQEEVAPKELKKRGRPCKITNDEPREPKKRGRPPKEKVPPPPKPPRVFKKDDPDYMKNYMYIREKDYYRTHYATIITCPSCAKQLTRQKLSRHLKTTFKCRFVRMDNELQDLKQKLSDSKAE